MAVEALGELGVAAAPEGAWEEVVGRYGNCLKTRVRGVLRRAGVRPRGEQVEEIVQEVYCRLLAAGGRRLLACRASNPEQVGAFLGRVAERVALDQLRLARAQKRGGEQGGPAATAVVAIAERAIDPRANPEERVLHRERVRLSLERCGILAGQRDARRNTRILALALAGWSSVDIARRLGSPREGLSARSVDGVLVRLRRRLAALDEADL